MADKDKNIFEKAIDAFSNRDEKAAEAEAKMAKMKADEEAAKRKAELDAKTAKLAADMKASTEALKQPKFLAEHKLTATETLSHLSLKYYGSAVRDYWMVIYEANKDIIGPNPNAVVVGTVLKIPVLPPNLPMKK